MSWLFLQSLDIKEMKDVSSLTKPDADKYFIERPNSSEFNTSKLPALHESK